MKWRPIKTAPKDGTPILLWLTEDIDRHYVSDNKASRICIGFFGSTSDWGDQNVWCSVEAKEDTWGMGGEGTGPMTSVDCTVVTPSHWMPLPKAPE
jgi:hypothetical protein